MKEGYSSETGHYIEFRPNPKQWKTNRVWNEQTRQFDEVEATFSYCTYCNAWGWAQKQLCPENYTIKRIPTAVPGGIK